MWTGKSRSDFATTGHADQARLAVFSRCADSVEQGRRLENLSWRLWQREQLVESSNHTSAIATSNTSDSTVTSNSLPQKVPSSSRIQEPPQLSGSVESLADGDEDAVDITSVSAPLEIRPRIRRLDSTTSRRDRRISSDDFGKMVVSIVKDKTPLSALSQPSPVLALTNKATTQTPVESTLTVPKVPPFERSGSTTASSQTSERPSEESQPSPLPARDSKELTARALPFPEPAAAAASSEDALPEPTSEPAAKHVQPKKQPAVFALGGSCSSSEQSQSIENLKVAPTSAAPAKKPVFHIGGSSGEESMKSSIQSVAAPAVHAAPALPPQLMTHSESAIDSDTEDEYVDESAIDEDDDSSDWEDSVEDSGKSSVDDKFFQRVPSKVNLTSRPSLITLMLAQNERAKTLGNGASQSTPALHPRPRFGPNGPGAPTVGGSPNDSDEVPLMMKGMRPSNLKPISEVPRSSAQPIAAPTSQPLPMQAALSPRTTRKQMLATELTESLRRSLLWERKQKSSTANAVLRRRHTSHDVANLKQYPEKACMKATEDAEANSWNQYFAKEALNGYHSKGW